VFVVAISSVVAVSLQLVKEMIAIMIRIALMEDLICTKVLDILY
jgi:hypothetical protein